MLGDDRAALARAQERAAVHAAGNFYLNDKPTGAVVGQQPFGGARASGTNDKAGSMWNLIRWASPRSIKETLVPPTDPRLPAHGLIGRSHPGGRRFAISSHGRELRCQRAWLVSVSIHGR